jgi:CubicO group peptidase (beta-lactamase class C family)
VLFRSESTTFKLDTGRSSGYGYLWWLTAQPAPAGSVAAVYASGAEGQYIGFMPQLDMVVVMTCAGSGMPAPDVILNAFVYPAVKGE